MYFKSAKPVWAEGLECEKNITCGFYAVTARAEVDAFIRIATSGFYRLFVNGSFVHHGPVRCAHGYFRVDEINIGKWLDREENHIAVEVVNYYINSYYSLKQSGFVQMELERDGNIVAATAGEPLGFSAFRLNERVQRMQRYSFQRTFGEAYRLNQNTNKWRMGILGAEEAIRLSETEPKRLLPRELPIATYPSIYPERVLERGEVSQVIPEQPPYRDRSVIGISDVFEGYRVEELEFCLSDYVQTLTYRRNPVAEKYEGSMVLSAGQYEILSLPSSRTGFPVVNFTCIEDSVFYLMFDEALDSYGDVSPLRVACLNVIKIEAKAGGYAFQGFEPIGCKYLKLVCIEGNIEIEDIHICETVCPIPIKEIASVDDEAQAIIFEAARQTFVQNSYDLFTDCPSRERAGWLCDSFFIGRMEHFFTGSNLMEKQFLENFLLPDSFEKIPDGMLPMCYPADHFDGVYIPNWSLWYVYELCDYYRRTNDRELIDRAYKKVERLFGFFEGYENEDGLLEKLDSWVFVEWSMANNLVQDVNFPTNMTYSAVLKNAGRLYGREDWIEKSEKIAQKVRELSFDGEFFVDNMVRVDGRLESSGERTETCQYYAFYFGIATPEEYPELWRKLTEEFGPEREAKGLYPEIHKSNAFIGNYLRLDILLEYGLYDMCREQIVGYFSDMAKKTGTLWENMTPGASCNHGFAAYAAYLLYYSNNPKKRKGD